MRLDAGRVMGAIVLVAWAVFLAWLLESGEVDRYIGPRTLWVVVFGAGAMTAIAAGYLFTLRARTGSQGRGGDGKEVAGLAVLLIPIAVVAAIPAPSLGSLAASRKLGGAPAALGAVRPLPGSGAEVSFPEIEYASQSAEYAANVGISDGYPVTLTGFVTRPRDLPAGGFALTRFAIYCCAADVVPHSVPVDPGGEYLNYNEDRWLTVEGILEERNGVFVLVAQEVSPTQEPDNPYIR